MKVLMSIKPKYAEKIFSGEKKWEYRRAFCKRYGLNKIYVYASAPISKVVGEFRMDLSVSYRWNPVSVAELWWYTHKESGITFEEFKEYFKGKHEGYGIKVKDVKRYDTPIPLSCFGIKRPPQNFMYIRDEITLNKTGE
jgi:predicted transcriptional regulator